MPETRRVPAMLWIYGAFCVAVVAFDFGTLVLGRNLREVVLPFTSWSVSTPYLFSLIFVAALVLGKHRSRSSVWAMVAIHVLYILVGLYGIATQPQHAATNPYLVVSPYRIVWVGLVPALWILVLRSRRITDFASGTNAAQA